MILLSNEEVKIEEVLAELKSRFGTSGHLEKASRGVSDEEK
jgi:phosphoribosyl-ATP pyrophosphohydrolase